MPQLISITFQLGRGVTGVIPSLASNLVAIVAEPNNIIKVMIWGIQRRDVVGPNATKSLVEKIRANPGI